MFRLSGLVLALAVGLVAVGVAQAQTLTTLASFNDSDGQCPFAGVTLSADGSTLYGTTFYGGANYDGEVFSLPVSGGSPTVLAWFNGASGYGPEAGLTLSGNTLYGTAFNGGAYGEGTVFALTVPEPSVLALLAVGAACLLGYGWHRRKRNS